MFTHYKLNHKSWTKWRSRALGGLNSTGNYHTLNLMEHHRRIDCALFFSFLFFSVMFQGRSFTAPNSPWKKLGVKSTSNVQRLLRQLATTQRDRVRYERTIGRTLSLVFFWDGHFFTSILREFYARFLSSAPCRPCCVCLACLVCLVCV